MGCGENKRVFLEMISCAGMYYHSRELWILSP